MGRERLGEQFPMPGEWWWLLRKRMLCARQQVLQVPLGGKGPLVPSHHRHEVRIQLVAIVDLASPNCATRTWRNGRQVCNRSAYTSSFSLRFCDALTPASYKNNC